MFDFPNSPFNGQQITGAGGVVYSWDGVKWGAAVPFTAYAPINNPVFTGDPQAPTPTLGDNDNSLATTAFVANTIAASPPPGAIMSATAPTGQNPGALWWDENGGQLYVYYNDGNSTQWVPSSNIGLANIATQTDIVGAQQNVGRNKLHNPLFNIAQRGVGPWTGNGNYTADRWLLGTTLDTVNVQLGVVADSERAQIGDEAAVTRLTNSFTGNAGATAGCFIEQHIENVYRLSGKTVTVSFWSNATGALKLGLNMIQIFGTGGSPSVPVAVQATGTAVTLSTTYARYTATFTVPSVAGKTIGTNGDSYTSLRLNYSSGANGNAMAGNIGVQSGGVNLWGVQLEVGSVATPLEKPDPRYDLANCQRFYQAVGAVQINGYSGGVGPTTLTGFWFPTMRAMPTAAVSSQSYVNGSALVCTPQGINTCQSYMTSAAAGAISCSFNISLSADL